MKLSLAALLLLSATLSCNAQAAAPCPLSSKFDPDTNTMQTVDCHGVVKQKSTPVAAETVKPAPSAQAASPIDPRLADSAVKFAIWQNDYTRRIFEYQNIYTVFIFIIVNLLVLAGLYFAWIQFKSTLHLSDYLKTTATSAPNPPLPIPAPPGPPAPGPFGDSDLKLGPDGIAIRSSFIGLIILGFAMGFYLMYLKYVYPIRQAGQDNPPAASAPAPPK